MSNIEDSNNSDKETNNEVELSELVSVLWNKKFFIFSISTLFAFISILYALSLPNMYISSALLYPADNKDSGSSMLGQYSGMASLAGISLASSGSDRSVEAIERIRSYDFFSKFFLPEISLQDLVAQDRWDASKNKLSYDEEIFDNKLNKWIDGIPSHQAAYKIYNDKLTISRDKKTFFVYISIKHKSPYIAQEWTEKIIKKINSSMRDEDKNIASKSVDFLNNQVQKVNYADIRQAIASLQESQMQSLMLIEANEDYIFRILDSPIVPEKKSEPRRSTIVILGTILGFFLSLIVSLASLITWPTSNKS